MKTTIFTFFFLFISIHVFAQLKVFSGGNITIGNTTAPASGIKMHVQGNSLFSTNSFSGNSAAYIHGLNGYSGATTPDYTWWGDIQTGIFHPAGKYIGFSIDGIEMTRITNLGHLLINSIYDNNFRLAVNGNKGEAAFGTLTNFDDDNAYAHASYVNRERTKNWVVSYNETEVFYVYGNGDVWSYTNHYTSDSSLKENIQPIVDARNKILALRGVKYNFKAPVLKNPNDTTTYISTIQPPTEIGLIAQEVELVVPEVVATNDHNLKGIQYQNLVALLIEGFKQQNADIVELRVQISACCNSPLPGSIQRTANSQTENSNLINARLDANIPNPFNTNTKISYYLPEKSTSKLLMIFDMQGVLLRQYSLHGLGEGSIIIEANEFKPGMYLYTLLIDNIEIDTKRMILTK